MTDEKPNGSSTPMLTRSELLMHRGILARERLLQAEIASLQADTAEVLRSFEAAHDLEPNSIGVSLFIDPNGSIIPRPTN